MTAIKWFLYVHIFEPEKCHQGVSSTLGQAAGLVLGGGDGCGYAVVGCGSWIVCGQYVVVACVCGWYCVAVGGEGGCRMGW